MVDQTHLRPNDVIPLGVKPGAVTLLASDNGLRFLPPDAIIGGQGNGGLWDVTVPITQTAAVALRFLGVSVPDIKAAGIDLG